MEKYAVPLALVIIAVVAALLIEGHKKPKKSKPAPNQKPQPATWQFFGPKGITGSPTPSGSGYTFIFLDHAGDHPRYVLGPPVPLVVGRALTMTYTITGGEFVAQEHPGQVASTSLYIQGRGDINDPGTRWFSRKALPLQEGSDEFNVLLDPEWWINVNGQHDPVAFARAIKNPAYVGNVFGSENGRGHGVYGDGQFTMRQLGVR